MRLTFNVLFSLGMVLLAIYLGGALLLSVITSPAGDDWLVDGRYVVLTAARYGPGSVTHFDFKAMEPPRNGGFYLIVGDGAVAAVFDRPGCRLEYRAAQADLYNPCTQNSYPVAAILDGTAQGRDLVRLPVRSDGGHLVVDVSAALVGR